MFFGWIASLITSSEEDAYDSILLHPKIYQLSLLFPGKKRTYTTEIRDLISEKSEKAQND